MFCCLSEHTSKKAGVTANKIYFDVYIVNAIDKTKSGDNKNKSLQQHGNYTMRCGDLQGRIQDFKLGGRT